MNSVQTIEITTLRSGQPRPYADSFYEYTVKFSWNPTERAVKQIVAARGHGDRPIPKMESESREWHEPFFRTCEKQEDGSWHILIVEPYLD